MLGRAAERFIRTTWPDIQSLAEELFATFSRDLPIQASQIIITQQPGDESPPFVINRPGDADGPSMVVNRGGGGDSTFGDITIHGNDYGATDFNFTPGYGLPDRNGDSLELFDFPPGGGIAGVGEGGGGGADLGDITFPGQEANSIPAPTDNPFMLYGEVVAKESGQTYSVNVWAKSPTGPRAGTISVRFPMVGPAEDIPAGTPTPVICFPALVGDTRTISDAVGFVPTFLPTS